MTLSCDYTVFSHVNFILYSQILKEFTMTWRKITNDNERIN